MDERSVWGRDHVQQWDVRRPDGTSATWPGAAAEHFMCPAAEEWQDYFSATCARVAQELHPGGIYVDQYGFADAWKFCHSPNHGHPVPAAPLRGEGQMLRKIRAAVPPQVAILSEETPVDAHAPIHDGALSYSVASTPAENAPHKLQLYRFAFPDFKVFQLVGYNVFLNGEWAQLKFPFFNGEGTWLQHDAHTGFDDGSAGFLKKAFAVLNAHHEAFRSPHPEPLVPTLIPGTFANAFPAERETVWTLYNGRYDTVRGEILAVPHVPGATYRDLWRDRELRPRIENGTAYIPVAIGPREVGAVVQVR